ncbi:MAG: hypothetical protein JWO60_1613 [Frankiales bacterium]|nr:hypothetical protein [Frankiales bacterium]
MRTGPGAVSGSGSPPVRMTGQPAWRDPSSSLQFPDLSSLDVASSEVGGLRLWESEGGHLMRGDGPDPSPSPQAPPGSGELDEAHGRVAAALADPAVNSLVAVSWGAGHLAAVARVLYPAAARTLPDGRARVRRQLAVDRRLQQDLWRLDRLLTGDARLAGSRVREVEQAVRRRLQQHADGARRLVVDVRVALSAQERDDLDHRLAVALRDGPTRPHPYTPHSRLAGRPTFWFWGVVDRARDLLDGRSVPTPRPVAVRRPVGRWGAYLMGATDWTPLDGPAMSEATTAPRGGLAE